VDFIVAQHLLEYISRPETVPLLKTFGRLLRPDGVLEIRVLDINRALKDLNLHQVSGELGLPAEMVLALLYGDQTTEWDIRKSGYTSNFLQGVISSVGMYKTNNVVYEDYDVILTMIRNEWK